MLCIKGYWKVFINRDSLRCKFVCPLFPAKYLNHCLFNLSCQDFLYLIFLNNPSFHEDIPKFHIRTSLFIKHRLQVFFFHKTFFYKHLTEPFCFYPSS